MSTKHLYGKTLICGTARIDGWAVGIVANQRKVVKSKKGRDANGRSDLLRLSR
jgi:acetyl-CoA carboxylase carboxyltransferase component